MTSRCTSTREDLITVPTAVLADLVDPMTCPAWSGVAPFETSDVLAALASPQRHTRRIPAEEHHPAHVHLARIAHLVETWVNDGSDPIDVEITPDGTAHVPDGHHRLCAAMVRGDEDVAISVLGFIDLTHHALGLDPAALRAPA